MSLPNYILLFDPSPPPPPPPQKKSYCNLHWVYIFNQSQSILTKGQMLYLILLNFFNKNN